MDRQPRYQHNHGGLIDVAEGEVARTGKVVKLITEVSVAGGGQHVGDEAGGGNVKNNGRGAGKDTAATRIVGLPSWFHSCWLVLSHWTSFA